MSLADAFEPLRFALERAGIRYAVGGSWASTAFGDVEEALNAIRRGKPFNLIHIPMAFKFDFPGERVHTWKGRTG